MQHKIAIDNICRAIAILLFLISSAQIAYAVPTILISDIVAEQQSVATSSLMVLDINHVAGIKLNITYDPNVAKIIDTQSTIQASSDFGMTAVNTDSGWITITAVALSPGLNSPVRIANLTFLVLGTPGTSMPIVINVIEFANYTKDGTKINPLKPGEYAKTESTLRVKAASGVPTVIVTPLDTAKTSQAPKGNVSAPRSTPTATETPVQTPAATSAATVPESMPEGAQTPSSPGFDAWILILLVAVYVFLSKVKGRKA